MTEYKAFISYSHAADGKLAPRLQAALHRFAIPWYRWRSRMLFRDETSLAMTPELWPDIQKALDHSEHFVLLASPEAAASQWVDKEIEYWLSLHRDKPLIIWTDGKVQWKGEDQKAGGGDFDWDSSTALPRRLKGVYSSEPLYLDLHWAKSESRVTLRDPRFRTAVARLTAALEGREVEQIIGLDIRYWRSLFTTAAVLGVVLLALTLISLVLGYLANAARDRAELSLANGKISEGNSLGLSDRWQDAGRRFSDAGQIFKQIGSSTFAADVGMWGYYRHVAPVLHSFDAHQGSIAFEALSADGRRLVTVANKNDRGSVCIWDTVTWSLVRRIDEPVAIADMSLSPNGSLLAMTFASTFSSKTGLPEKQPAVLLNLDGGENPKFPPQASDSAIVVCWADNTKIVTGGSDRRVNVWNVATSERDQPEVENFPAYVNAVGASEDGKVVAWGSDWKGSSIGEKPVTSVAVSPDGEFAAYGHPTGLLELAGKSVPKIPSLVMEGPVVQIFFALGGRWLLGRSGPKAGQSKEISGRSLRLWDLTTGLQARTLEDVPKDVSSCAISANGAMAVTGDSHGRVVVWGLWDPAMRSIVTNEEMTQGYRASQLVACPGGRLMLRTGPFGDIELWSTDTRHRLRRYSRPPPQIHDSSYGSPSAPQSTVAFVVSANLRSVIARDDQNHIFGWDLATQSPFTPDAALATLLPPTRTSEVIGAASPDGSRTARADGKLTLLLKPGSNHLDPVSWTQAAKVKALSFGPTGDWIFSATADRSLRLWDASDLQSERFLLHIGCPQIVGKGTIESPGVEPSSWDSGGSAIAEPSALINTIDYISPDNQLLVGSECGAWVLDFNWANRAKVMAPAVEAARERLDANGQDPQALLLTAQWFALEGVYDSAIAFFERALTAGGKPDPYLLCTCYLSKACEDEPSPPDAQTPAEIQRLQSDWHLHRSEFALKAENLADEVVRSGDASIPQRQTAAAYAAICQAIESEEQSNRTK